jgi:phosphatidylglycerophosphatase A
VSHCAVPPPAALDRDAPAVPLGVEIPTLVDSLALVIATGFGAGLVPGAPGTAGSALGVGVHLALAPLGAPLYLAATAAVTLLGIAAADRCERIFGRKDDGRIVIDEVAGQLLTLAPLVLVASPKIFSPWFWLVTGFVTFRVFDIRKPGPARFAERHFAGGAGVVLDDVVAGAFGALVMIGLIALANAVAAPGAGALQ